MTNALLDDSMPLAALSIGQAKSLIGGLITEQLAGLESRTSHKLQPKECLTIDEAISYLKEFGVILTKGSIYKMNHEGQIPCKRIGKRLVFSRTNLQKWTESRESVKPSRADAALSIAESALRK